MAAPNEPQLRQGNGTFGPARTRGPVETFPEPGRTIYGGAVERATLELSHAYRGVTSGGTIVPNLFPLRRTGVSLAPVVAAAAAFADSLDEARRNALTFDIDDEQRWRMWHNMHPNLMRHGICLFDWHPHSAKPLWNSFGKR